MKLCFQKDTYGQSYTTAWRAKHFPASFCSFFQNLGHPKNKIKAYSLLWGGKKKKSYIPVIHIIMAYAKPNDFSAVQRPQEKTI